MSLRSLARKHGLTFVAIFPGACVLCSGVTYFVASGNADRHVVVPLMSAQTGQRLTPGGGLDVKVLYPRSLALALFGDLAVVHRDDAIIVADIADPAHPRLVATHQAGLFRVEPSAEMVVHPPHVCFVGSEARASVHCVDMTSPRTPKSAGSIEIPEALGDCALDGDHLFLTVHDPAQTLVVVDLSDPEAPKRIGDLKIPGTSPEAIAVSGGYAYLFGGEELHIVDVRQPAAPRFVGVDRQIGCRSRCSDATVSDGVLWLMDGDALQLIALRDPTSPKTVGQLRLPGDGYNARIAVEGHYGYALHGAAPGLSPGIDTGVVAIDGREPARPRIVARFTDDRLFRTGFNWTLEFNDSRIAVRGGTVFVAGRGLVVLRHTGRDAFTRPPGGLAIARTRAIWTAQPGEAASERMGAGTGNDAQPVPLRGQY